MKLASVDIENYRAIEHLRLEPDPTLNVLFGANGCGKTAERVVNGGLGSCMKFFRLPM